MHQRGAATLLLIIQTLGEFKQAKRLYSHVLKTVKYLISLKMVAGTLFNFVYKGAVAGPPGHAVLLPRGE
jgi:hypothetical protein